MKKLLVLIMVLLTGLTLGFIGEAQAVLYQAGDVFAGGSFGGLGNVYQFRPGSGLIATYTTSFTAEETGMAFDSSGNLYVTNFGSSNITKFDNSGNIILPNPFVTNDASSHNESIIFNKLGQMYIGQADGTRDIIKRDSAGNFLARFDVATGPRGSDWIDLAADQNTIFYTSEGDLIRRFDVSTNTQLTDFANVGGQSFALRLLGDGGLLVANRNTILRLDSLGNVIKIYDVAGNQFWFALNLDPDGTSFWSADYNSGLIQEFDIASASALLTFTAPSNISGLAVFGEITQGGGGGGGEVPEPATMILLGSGLIGLWGARKKFKK